MSHDALQALIERAFEDRAAVNANTQGDVRQAVETALQLLDDGNERVAEKIPGAEGAASWKVNQWLKKAVLLSFRLNDNTIFQGGPGGATWWDKIPSKFADWGENRFVQAGFRAVPGCVVRYSAFIARDAILMPSFVNLGAYVDTKTMVDTWVTVGSCAQIGKNVHLSGGVGIGGVLEPLQANPTIIEDDCFIGARSEVVEGVIVGRGSVLSMGVYYRRVDEDCRPRHRQDPLRLCATLFRGGLGFAARQSISGRFAWSVPYCAVIVKTVDEQTRSKTGINELFERLMADASIDGRFRFLYRQSEGTIDRATWARASVLPIGAALVLTAFAF